MNAGPIAWGQRQQDASHGEDPEAQVVQPGPAVNVRDPPAGDEQRRRYQHVTEQQSEKIIGFRGHERIDPNAFEDGRHGDQDKP